MSTPSSAHRDIRGYFPVKPAPTRTPKTSTSPVGTSDEEDPLSAPMSAESARPSAPSPQSRLPGEQANKPTPPPVRSRIAVILAASPSKRTLSVTPDAKREEDAAGSVPPGPPPRLKQQTAIKETPVPLPKIPHHPAPSAAPPPAPPSTQSRGRPKGWKPGMSYSVMRGNGPPGARTRQVRAKAPPPGFGRRRRRQQKPPSPRPVEIYHQLEPQFVEFLCEWAGCKAELHNLDTLRRHIHVAHDRGGRRTCRWGKCGSAEPPREFPNAEQFERHIEEAHLVPFAWHIGDGPRNGEQNCKTANGLGDEVPDFLKDADGNQVTPSVRDQEVEDLATWRANRRRLKELLIQRNENLPDEESDEPDDDHGQV